MAELNGHPQGRNSRLISMFWGVAQNLSKNIVHVSRTLCVCLCICVYVLAPFQKYDLTCHGDIFGGRVCFFLIQQHVVDIGQPGGFLKWRDPKNHRFAFQQSNILK